MTAIFFMKSCLIILFLTSIEMKMTEEKDDMMFPYGQIYYYSGRPNPRWKFSIEEWKELNQFIEKLPKLIENTQRPYQLIGDLGYSGFSANFAIISSYPDIYYVKTSRQAVLSNPGGHIIYNDHEKTIETWFKQNAKHHGIPLPIQ